MTVRNENLDRQRKEFIRKATWSALRQHFTGVGAAERRSAFYVAWLKASLRWCLLIVAAGLGLLALVLESAEFAAVDFWVVGSLLAVICLEVGFFVALHPITKPVAEKAKADFDRLGRPLTP